MNTNELREKAQELIEASKQATTHRGRWVADIDAHDWIDKVKVENLGVVCRVEKARFEASTFNNAEFIALCGNNAASIAQAYLNALHVLEKIKTPMPGSRDNELVLYYERLASEFLEDGYIGL